MKFLLRNWYNFSGILALISLAVFPFIYGEITYLQGLLFLNFVVLHIHVWEEFAFPGGFPMFANTVAAMKDSPRPERYPLNQLSAWVGNWTVAFVFYLIPVFFPDLIWFGLMPILFGAAQVIFHGVLSNVLSRQWYNPGLASALFGHLPIAILYISYIHSNGLVSWVDYVIAIIYMVIMYAFIFRKLIIGSLADINSPYPFTEKELAKYKRWDKFKIGKKKN